MKKTDIIKLESKLPEGTYRVMSDCINLAEGKRRTVGTLTRVFKYPDDPYYGELSITSAMLKQMVKNFSDDVYGQKIYINQAHCDSNGAAGEIIRVFTEGKKLKAEIDWTDFGVELIQKKGFRYFSAEFTEDYKNPETESRHGATLLGAALTIRPRVKHLDPVNPDELQLSEDDQEIPYLISPNVIRMLSEEITTMWDKLRKQLEEKLKAKKLSDSSIKLLLSKFDEQVTKLTEETQAIAVMEAFDAAGKELADAIETGTANPDQPINLSVNVGGPAGMDEAAVTKLMEDNAKAAAAAATKLSETLDGNVKKFTVQLEASDSYKNLSESQQKDLSDAGNLITAEMTDDQIKALADNQLKHANNLAVQTQLSSIGFGGAAGHVHISMDESNSIKELQETMDKRIGLASKSEAKRFEKTGGKLLSENKEFAEKVLSQFDQFNAGNLHKEAKMLAGGDGVVSDVAVPIIWERTVIREALYALTSLPLVDVGSVQFAAAYNIPYSYRDTTGAGIGDTRKYQGGSINRAGVIQTSETAYNTPQKLAFEVSDELRYITAASSLNWEAVSENQANASRIIGEDLDRLNYNEMLNAADEYGAVAVALENHDAEADGANVVIALTNFPVVRPRSVYDLEGNQVGVTVNPIVVTLNVTNLEEYDGTNTQSAGNYYSLDYNLGLIRYVNELGVGAAWTLTTLKISYSYATNVLNWDTDLGALEADVKWNDFLYRYGLRKSIIEDDRYHMANMGFMRGTPFTNITQAKKFEANSKTNGIDLLADGSLGRIKDVPNFKAFGPSLNVADNRIVIGERGTTRFKMTKPWTLGELENQKDTNGRFTGKKEAYGDQFVVIHTPSQLKRALTSINLHSATGRVTA
jgi:Mu-like prophage I protein